MSRAPARRRRICAGLAVLVAVPALAVAGCGGSGSAGAPDASEQLRISGSGATSRVLEELQPAYQASQADVRLAFLEGTDSGGGIAAVNEREIEIGAVSRAPRPGELAAGARYQAVASDAAAFVTNGVDVRGLSRRQVVRAFSGKVRNWRELGGPDRPIVLLIRDEDESLTQVLRSALFGEDFEFSPRAVVLSSASDMNEALVSTPAALGYTSYGSIHASRADLHILRVGGVAPSLATLTAGTYPFTRPLGVVFRPDPRTSAFASYLHGDDVARRLRSLGYAPRA